MTVVSDLRARGLLTGVAVRPSGADRFGPPVGTRVPWVLCQPIADLLAQGKWLGWQNLGTIGNEEHRKKHGDHTPWSLGKVPGVLYAKDTHVPDWFRTALLALCARDDYDTTWIDFFNIDGSQYDFAGRRLGPSGDVHLHVSARKGKELVRVTLFDDTVAVHAGTFRKPSVPMPGIFSRLGFIDGASLVRVPGAPEVWLTGRGKRAQVANVVELTAIRAYLRSRNMNDIISLTTLAELAPVVIP